MLLRPPPQWGPHQVDAFNNLMNAVGEFELYAATLARLGIVAGVFVARRDELRDHIVNTLGPAFRDTPAGT